MKIQNLLIASAFIISICGFAAAYKALNVQNIGAALPSATASFETSLQSAVTSSATTMTLTANAVRGGGALSGFNCFTVDEGSAQAETICGTVSGTSVTGLTRGISQATGTTTVAALQFAHRRGANVKISDFPIIQIMKAQLNGEDTVPNLLTYANTVLIGAGSPTSTVATKYYVDNVAVAGASNADETTKGIIELATQIEMASSTNLGSTGAVLALQSKYATSSPYTTGLWTVITKNSGKISQAFLDLTENITFVNSTSTFSGATALATSTQFGVYGGIAPVGSMIAYASTTAPAGWLLCNGASLLRSAYPALFQVLGTSYGAADGTHFTLPNLLGRTPIMASTTVNIGQTGGEDAHTMTLAELVAHSHTTSVGNGAGGANVTQSTAGATPGANTGSTGSSVPFNVRDPYLAVQYIIKY